MIHSQCYTSKQATAVSNWRPVEPLNGSEGCSIPEAQQRSFKWKRRDLTPTVDGLKNSSFFDAQPGQEGLRVAHFPRAISIPNPSCAHTTGKRQKRPSGKNLAHRMEDFRYGSLLGDRRRGGVQVTPFVVGPAVPHSYATRTEDLKEACRSAFTPFPSGFCLRESQVAH